MSEATHGLRCMEAPCPSCRIETVLVEHEGGPWCFCGFSSETRDEHRAHLAQALLDSPAMRDLLADVWDEGYGNDEECGIPRANPYRAEADR